MGNQQGQGRESIPSVYQKIILESTNLANGLTEVRPRCKLTKQRMKQVQAEIVDFNKFCKDVAMVQEAFKQEKWLKIVGFNLNIDIYARTSGRKSNPNVKISKISKSQEKRVSRSARGSNIRCSKNKSSNNTDD